MNPELRQTLQHISRNIESANEAAQENIYTFTQLYVDPCLGGVKACVYDYTTSCFPSRDEQSRRRRGRPQGRGQYDFDFYDDWDEDELGDSSGLGWGDDELDSLLAGRGSPQPRRQRAMSYGTRRRREDADSDPTVVPKSSFFGFLDLLPFRLGPNSTRYKPSGANLEENPGGLRIRDVESAQPLLDDEHDAEFAATRKGHSRQRSGTAASRSTATSHSSRGDLIMSDEDEDAVPLDDEFAAVMLSRRTTGLSVYDDHSIGKGHRSDPNSRVGSRTVSSRSLHRQRSRRSSGKLSKKSAEASSEIPHDSIDNFEPPSIMDLKREEEELRRQEDLDIALKREAAQRLAQSKGLDTGVKPAPLITKSITQRTVSLKSPSKQSAPSGYFALTSPISPDGETEPFPGYDTPSKSPRSPQSMRGRAEDEPPCCVMSLAQP